MFRSVFRRPVLEQISTSLASLDTRCWWRKPVCAPETTSSRWTSMEFVSLHRDQNGLFICRGEQLPFTISGSKNLRAKRNHSHHCCLINYSTIAVHDHRRDRQRPPGNPCAHRCDGGSRNCCQERMRVSGRPPTRQPWPMPTCVEWMRV